MDNICFLSYPDGAVQASEKQLGASRPFRRLAVFSVIPRPIAKPAGPSSHGSTTVVP
jgi:hypothetical protein